MDNILEKNYTSYDDKEQTLRPKYLRDYTGQAEIKEMLSIYISTARSRNESLDHVLLFGPPGLGKTTLAHIIANEMGANILIISGPALNKPGDLVAILAELKAGDVLFIDEIHRLPKVMEEMLYSAMEDFVIDIVIGKDQQAQTLRINLPPFTLVGATTRYGDLSHPMRDRFGIIHTLHYYTVSELSEIINRTSKILHYPISMDASLLLARRSRGTPRIANRLFRRIRDFAQYENKETIDADVTSKALDKLNIDKAGLDLTDRRYLNVLINQFKGGPVGLDALASTISEEAITLEDVNEPYLLQEGFIIRTSRGRMATRKAYDHLNIDYHTN